MGEPIIDPVGVPEIFATELSKIERVGKAWRFTVTVQQGDSKVVVAKIVMPIEAAAAAALKFALLRGNT
jgi:hypothetical protein